MSPLSRCPGPETPPTHCWVCGCRRFWCRAAAGRTAYPPSATSAAKAQASAQGRPAELFTSPPSSCLPAAAQEMSFALMMNAICLAAQRLQPQTQSALPLGRFWAGQAPHNPVDHQWAMWPFAVRWHQLGPGPETPPTHCRQGLRLQAPACLVQSGSWENCLPALRHLSRQSPGLSPGPGRQSCSQAHPAAVCLLLRQEMSFALMMNA